MLDVAYNKCIIKVSTKRRHRLTLSLSLVSQVLLTTLLAGIEDVRKKERKNSLTRGHVKDIGSAVGIHS